MAGDLRTSVRKLKDATPGGLLLGSGKLATELDRLDLIDEYKFLVHPRIDDSVASKAVGPARRGGLPMALMSVFRYRRLPNPRFAS